MYYESLDFPSLPDNLTQEIIEWYEIKRKDLVLISGSKHLKLMNDDNKLLNQNHPQKVSQDALGLPNSLPSHLFRHTLAQFGHMKAPKSVGKWVKHNLPLPFSDIIVGLQEMAYGKFCVPHIDVLRSVAYNYLIDAGGPDVRTCFYEPKPEFQHLSVTARTYIPYERIDLVESVKFDSGKWYKLHVNKIHNVENLDPNQRRLAITLSSIN